MAGSIEVRFGGLSPKLHEQAYVPTKVLEWEQKMADGVLLCKVQGIITEGESRKIYQRLANRIGATVGSYLTHQDEKAGSVDCVGTAR